MSVPPPSSDRSRTLLERSPFLAFPAPLAIVALASVGINLLMLTGPFFMLQVYDRVLPSGSGETLFYLFVLVGILYSGMGFMELARSRLLSRMSTHFSLRLRETLLPAVMKASLQRGAAMQDPMKDYGSIAGFMGGPALSALFDVPLMLIYLGVIYLIHPVLFYLAVGAAVLLFGLAVLNHALSRKPQKAASQAGSRMMDFFASVMRNMEAVAALGMLDPLLRRLKTLQNDSLWWDARTRDVIAGVGAFTKVIRLFLQSAMLALGAWLALRHEISAGMMIMGTILLGRALQPVEQAIIHWRGYQQYRNALQRLRAFLRSLHSEAEPRTVPENRPKGHLEARELHVAAPTMSRPWLVNVSFRVNPGQILWVTGRNGSGKTMLARALAGIWTPVAGQVLLDGADLRSWPPHERGRLIGYLPQEPQLIEGTIGENIARFDPDATEEAIIDAARRAGVHEAIKAAGGYDRPVGPDGRHLSGGMRQRVALARAFYGDPVLFILDEPFANLDEGGQQQLLQALMRLKQEGKTVVVIDHVPLAGQAADLRLVLEEGRVKSLDVKRKAPEPASITRFTVPAGGQKGQQG